MTKTPRIANDILLQAGLTLMGQNGKPLRKVSSFGRSMMYALPNGETVRVRTCNDPILIILSDKASGDDAKLNIEGTDWLLIVMPEIPRTPGKVLAYLVPTEVAVSTCRKTHALWLATKPNTSGNSTTWNIWFDDGHKPWNGFASKWSKYLLEQKGVISQAAHPRADMKSEIEEARQRVSRAAGVPLDAVKITIQFGL
jgi:hypothetical protein